MGGCGWEQQPGCCCWQLWRQLCGLVGQIRKGVHPALAVPQKQEVEHLQATGLTQAPDCSRVVRSLRCKARSGPTLLPGALPQPLAKLGVGRGLGQGPRPNTPNPIGEGYVKATSPNHIRCQLALSSVHLLVSTLGASTQKCSVAHGILERLGHLLLPAASAALCARARINTLDLCLMNALLRCLAVTAAATAAAAAVGQPVTD